MAVQPMNVTPDGSSAADVTKPIGLLQTAGDLTTRASRLRQNRKFQETEWMLALAFEDGKHYVKRNRVTGELIRVGTEPGEVPAHRVRIAANAIRENSQKLLALLTKTKPRIEVSPGTASPTDMKTSEVSKFIVDYLWDELDLQDKENEAIRWAIHCGQGWWQITWDANAGEQMLVHLDPEGNPITDPYLLQLFQAELAQLGMQVETKLIPTGEVCVSVKSPFHVIVDDSVSTYSESKYVIVEDYLDPVDVEKKYGVTGIQPDTVAQDWTVNAPWENQTEKRNNKVLVRTLYHLPVPTLPQGRIVTWIKDRVLADEPWSIPFKRLPLVKWPGNPKTGQVYDVGFTKDAIPLQKMYNRMLSIFLENMNQAANPGYWAPRGAVRREQTLAPGQISEFNPTGNGGGVPTLRQVPQLPNFMVEQLQNVDAKIQAAYCLTDVVTGTLPPNLEAAQAIDLLQEMGSERIMPVITQMEKALALAGEMIIRYAQAFYTEERTIQIVGPGGKQKAFSFKQADLRGNISVKVEAGSGLPRLRAARQLLAQQLYAQGILRPDQYVTSLELTDQSLVDRFHTDQEEAENEHMLMISGEPVNQTAFENAQEQVRQGQNPATGQPIADPYTGQFLASLEEIQDAVMDAGLQPMMWQNHDIHLDTHTLFMKSAEYRQLPHEVRERFETHVNGHYSLRYQLLQMSMQQEAPKTSLQIRTDVGPTALAQLLDKSGVNISPQDLQEPPVGQLIEIEKIEPPAPEEADPAQEAHDQLDLQLHAEKLRKATAEADSAEQRASQPPSGKE